jgi:hypothetical protein
MAVRAGRNLSESWRDAMNLDENGIRVPMRVLSLLLLLTAGSASNLNVQSPGTFTAAGRMTTERVGHTATLLTTGRVLIAGGSADDKSALSSAELYDPSSRTFVMTGNMINPRLQHTATLLPTGKILIAGGASQADYVSGDSALASAELYDPGTGTFSATGDMTIARWYHTATLLNNGKVLVAGGMTIGGGLLASAELYDPATGTFTLTGDMATSRDLHTATLLSNGRVLIQGSGEGKFMSAAELYDSNSGTFSLTARTINSEFSDTATLLTNGKVLVTYGNNNGYSADAEVYDPSTGTFAATEHMTAYRGDSYTATLLPDGSVLIAGDSVPHNSEFYDPGTGTFSPTGDMATGRQSHTATLLPDGSVLISGGWSVFHGIGSPELSDAEIYHPAALAPAAALLSLSGDGKGPGAIQHANTYQVVSIADPAIPGEALVVYCTGLTDGSLIPPQVAISGRMAEVLWFGNTPGFFGLNQINVRLPSDITPGPSLPVRLNYRGRPSNEVTISVR